MDNPFIWEILEETVPNWHSRLHVVLPVLLATTTAVAANPLPTITHVKFTAHDGTYDATIIGRNFGVPPVALPCNACTIPELTLRNMVAVSTDEPLTITAWTDTSISVSGITGRPGDAVWVAVKNDALNNLGVYSRNLPCGEGHPKITSIALSGDGMTRQIIVTGYGFGSAPPGVPGSTDILYFSFWDWNIRDPNPSNFPWSGGLRAASGGRDAVLLNYASWTDTQIVIAGFGSGYGGFYDWTAKHGDPFAVTVWATSGPANWTGPQTGKAGRLP